MNALEQLAEHGYHLDRPHVAYLRDDIYELRVKTRNGNFRCLYFFYHRERIVVTHGFKKKTQKTPEAEIQRAVEYRRDYYQSQEQQL